MSAVYASPPSVIVDRLTRGPVAPWLARADEWGRLNQTRVLEHARNAVDWLDANPTSTFTITFPEDGPRALIVLTDVDGIRRAFYQSTGRNGGANAGEWIPFHGFVERRRSPLLRWVWLVKEGKEKFPDPYEQPEAFRFYHLLKWAGRAGLIDAGTERVISDYGSTGTLQGLKDAYEGLGDANKWLQFHGALEHGARWRLPFPEAPIADYNQPFPLIGIDQRWSDYSEKLRAGFKAAGIPAREAMRLSPDTAFRRAGFSIPVRPNPYRVS